MQKKNRKILYEDEYNIWSMNPGNPTSSDKIIIAWEGIIDSFNSAKSDISIIEDIIIFEKNIILPSCPHITVWIPKSVKLKETLAPLPAGNYSIYERVNYVIHGEGNPLFDEEYSYLGELKVKTNRTGSIRVSGVMEANKSEFINTNEVYIRVGSYEDIFPREAFRKFLKKDQYIFHGLAKDLPVLKLDFNSGEFLFNAKNVDLTGLQSPVEVELSYGEFWGSALAFDEGEADVINGKKKLPIQFLAGFKDSLRVNKVKCKSDKSGSVIDVLRIQGEFTSDEIIDLADTDMILFWGEEALAILKGEFKPKGNGKYLYRKKTSRVDPLKTDVFFDFTKSSFSVILKNTNMRWQPAPLEFYVDFDGYKQSQVVNIY